MSRARLEERLAGLATMSPAQLRQEWRRTFRREVPPHSPDLLARAIAWQWQARVEGSLTTASRKRLEQLAIDSARITSANQSGSPLTPGTRIVREWNGRTLQVMVMESGFLFEDRQFRSLSQIATHVAGVKWSGPRFFGLTKVKSEARA